MFMKCYRKRKGASIDQRGCDSKVTQPPLLSFRSWSPALVPELEGTGQGTKSRAERELNLPRSFNVMKPGWRGGSAKNRSSSKQEAPG